MVVVCCLLAQPSIMEAARATMRSLFLMAIVMPSRLHRDRVFVNRGWLGGCRMVSPQVFARS
jgi:hypothetical protein